MSWREVILRDHLDVLSGAAFKSKFFTDNSDNVPLIKGENIGQRRILWEKSRYWPQEDIEDYSKYVLAPNDIVLAMDRPWVTAGLKYARISKQDPQCLLVQRVARLRGRNGLSQGFLHCIISSDEFSSYIKLIMGGTNVPHISADQIKNFRFKLPPDNEQKKISEILFAYDDLIENNRRRIQLLEESARLLYREWFVHLRFPGHEHVKVVDGVPEGWERKLISEVCETLGGGTPSTQKPEYWIDGDIPWVVPTDITRNKSLALLDTEKKITASGLRNSSAKMVPPHTILMTSRASVGFFALMNKEVCTNQGFINVIPHDNHSRMYILHNLMHRVDEIRSHAGGSTYKEINKTRFRALPIIMPTQLLLQEFSDSTSSMFQQVEVLEQQNQKLQKARDLLLPRLMNGEITV